MNPMRLMTANLLHHRGATAAALRDALDVVKPDLLAVQEATTPLAGTIENHFAYHLLTARPDGSGVGMAADRNVSFEDLPMPLRSGMIATLDPEDWPEFGGPIEIFNLHLGNPIERSPWAMTRIRRAQIQAVERRVASAGPRRIICGDLNATPLWPAYRRLLRSHRDGILESATAMGKRPPRTWAKARTGPRLLRIDHVLVSGMRVVTAETVRLVGSDHLAVVADLVDDLEDP
jgi:endonuclease/exonuclease/phosphatase family metal-dependent hydrolase